MHQNVPIHGAEEQMVEESKAKATVSMTVCKNDDKITATIVGWIRCRVGAASLEEQPGWRNQDRWQAEHWYVLRGSEEEEAAPCGHKILWVFRTWSNGGVNS